MSHSYSPELEGKLGGPRKHRLTDSIPQVSIQLFLLILQSQITFPIMISFNPISCSPKPFSVETTAALSARSASSLPSSLPPAAVSSGSTPRLTRRQSSLLQAELAHLRKLGGAGRRRRAGQLARDLGMTARQVLDWYSVTCWEGRSEATEEDKVETNSTGAGKIVAHRTTADVPLACEDGVKKNGDVKKADTVKALVKPMNMNNKRVMAEDNSISQSRRASLGGIRNWTVGGKTMNRVQKGRIGKLMNKNVTGSAIKMSNVKFLAKKQILHTPKLEQRLVNHEKMLQSRRDLRKKALEAIDNVKENRTKVVSVEKLDADMNAFAENLVNSFVTKTTGDKSVENCNDKKTSSKDIKSGVKDLEQKSSNKSQTKLDQSQLELQKKYDQLKRSHALCSAETLRMKTEAKVKDAKIKEFTAAQKKADKLIKLLEKSDAEAKSLKKLLKEKSMHDKEKDKMVKEIDDGQKTVLKQIDLVRKSKSQVEKDTQKKLDEKDAVLTLMRKENEDSKLAVLDLRRRIALLEEEDSGDRSLGSRLVKHHREKRQLVEECKERSFKRQSLRLSAGGLGSEKRGREEEEGREKRGREEEQGHEERPGKRQRLEALVETTPEAQVSLSLVSHMAAPPALEQCSQVSMVSLFKPSTPVSLLSHRVVSQVPYNATSMVSHTSSMSQKRDGQESGMSHKLNWNTVPRQVFTLLSQKSYSLMLSQEAVTMVSHKPYSSTLSHGATTMVSHNPYCSTISHGATTMVSHKLFSSAISHGATSMVSHKPYPLALNQGSTTKLLQNPYSFKLSPGSTTLVSNKPYSSMLSQGEATMVSHKPYSSLVYQQDTTMVSHQPYSSPVYKQDTTMVSRKPYSLVYHQDTTMVSHKPYSLVYHQDATMVSHKLPSSLICQGESTMVSHKLSSYLVSREPISLFLLPLQARHLSTTMVSHQLFPLEPLYPVSLVSSLASPQEARDRKRRAPEVAEHRPAKKRVVFIGQGERKRKREEEEEQERPSKRKRLSVERAVPRLMVTYLWPLVLWRPLGLSQPCI